MSKVLQSNETFLGAFFGEEFSCPVPSVDVFTDKERQQSINDCYAMLQYSLDQQDKDEVAFWRRMLQRAKVEKRSVASIT